MLALHTFLDFQYFINMEFYFENSNILACIYIMYVIYYSLFIYSKSGSIYILRNGYFNVWEMVQSKKSLCANVRS